MCNKYLEFINQLKTTKLNKEYNANLNPRDWYYRRKETYSFHLCSRYHCPSVSIFGQQYSELIKLDDEDIEYFKNKYLPKVNEQFQEELQKLKERFDKNE